MKIQRNILFAALSIGICMYGGIFAQSPDTNKHKNLQAGAMINLPPAETPSASFKNVRDVKIEGDSVITFTLGADTYRTKMVRMPGPNKIKFYIEATDGKYLECMAYVDDDDNMTGFRRTDTPALPEAVFKDTYDKVRQVYKQ